MNPFATTTADVAPPISEFYVRTLLERIDPYLVWGQFGDQKRMRKGHGNQIKFRRYHALDTTPVELPEGVPPTGKRLNSTDITQIIRYYADVVWLTDELILESIDPVMAESAEILGEQAGQIIDQVHRNYLVAGTNMSGALDDFGNTTATRTNIAGRLNKVFMDKAIRILSIAHAREITPGIGLTEKFGGASVSPSFWAIMGPQTTFDFNNVPGRTLVKDYAANAGVLMSERGAYGRIRLVESGYPRIWLDGGSSTVPTGIASNASAVDVHATVIFGSRSHGAIKMDGRALEFIVKQLGSSGTADPVNQIASTAWKAAAAAVITNDNWMLRLEHGVSA